MNEENENNNCCKCIDELELFWEKHKKSLSSKLSIALGVAGGLGSILVGMKLYVSASIVLGLCNVGIFFSGIALEKMSTENAKKSCDIESLQNEKNEMVRRFTMVQQNINNNEPDSITPTNSDDTVEPINFEQMHQNNILQTAIQNYEFPNSNN